MRFLLDVNALIALGIDKHQFHIRISKWAAANISSEFLTTSITEIGFLRIVSQAPTYAVNLDKAKELLISLKSGVPLGFISDANDCRSLPAWVTRPGQITDGHLMYLAFTHGAVLATFDAGIPGAFLIP